jgi:hypothetical protein
VGRGQQLLPPRGWRRKSTDPDVIAAALAKPGVVLERPVGSDGPFGEYADCRKISSRTDRRSPPQSHRAARRQHRQREPTKRRIGRLPKRTNGSGSVASARKRRKKRPDRRNANAGSGAVDTAQAALDKAEDEHAKRVTALRSQIEAIEKKIQAEETNWDGEPKRLKAACGGREAERFSAEMR